MIYSSLLSPNKYTNKEEFFEIQIDDLHESIEISKEVEE